MYSTYVNDVNVTSVDRPSMVKLRFVVSFRCDHVELECAGRLVVINVGGSLLRAFGL